MHFIKITFVRQPTTQQPRVIFDPRATTTTINSEIERLLAAVSRPPSFFWFVFSTTTLRMVTSPTDGRARTSSTGTKYEYEYGLLDY